MRFPAKEATHGLPFLAARTGAVALAAWLAATADAAAERSSALIGQLQTYVTSYEDTLLDVAREHDLGYMETLLANPGIDPWLPGEDTPILLPTAHLLPDAPREGIVINLPELRLYYFPGNGAPPQTFPIGIGREGFMTPLGRTEIVRKRVNPTWIPTASTRADNPELPAVVPPGPDNPLGSYALDLGWPTYAIHGTNMPWGVGRRVSRGCIRLYPEDIDVLFPDISIGTRVTVINQPMKIGWHEGDLYVQVYPPLEDLENNHTAATLNFSPATQLVSLIVANTIDGEADRIDWAAIQRATAERRGIPIRITR